jgi:hypothetical protein
MAVLLLASANPAVANWWIVRATDGKCLAVRANGQWLAWNCDTGGIRTSNDDLGLGHAVCLDKMIDRGGVWQRETDATTGDWRAKARMVRAMNAVSSFGEEDRVGPALSHAGA